MTTAKGPGWYPDPSGLKGKFRWWDGNQWTQVLSDSPRSPAPRTAPPFVRPRPAPVRPRPVPETRTSEIGRPEVGRAEVRSPEAGTDDDERSRRPLVLGVGGAVLVAVAATVGVIWWLNSAPSQEPAASNRPASTTASPSTPTADRTAPPTARPQQAGKLGRTAPPAPPGGRLTFTPLEAWQDASGVAHMLGDGQAATFPTEKAYDGKSNWQALLVAGDLPGKARVEGELAGQANAVLSWFVRTEWRTEPSSGPSDGRALTVDGRPAYLVRGTVSYDIKGLRSQQDQIEVVVIDYGPNRPRGVVIASVPETHPELWKDVERAVTSLRWRP